MCLSRFRVLDQGTKNITGDGDSMSSKLTGSRVLWIASLQLQPWRLSRCQAQTSYSMKSAKNHRREPLSPSLTKGGAKPKRAGSRGREAHVLRGCFLSSALGLWPIHSFVFCSHTSLSLLLTLQCCTAERP